MAGVSFWRFAMTYGQERTDIRVGHAFEAGLRFWRAAFSADHLGEREADAARTTFRRGAITAFTGWATCLVGVVVAAVALGE